MLLAVNIGNSNIIMGGYVNKELVFESRLKTETAKTEYEYAVMIKDVIAVYGCEYEQLEGCIIASVVPQLTQVIGKAVSLLKKVKIMYIAPGVKTGLNISLDNPAQLGADLVACAVGAVEKYKLPAIVINMDTATSMLLLDAERRLVGGSIMPGVLTGLSALVNKAARLSSISMEGDVPVVGSNTESAMRSGTVLGTASMLDGMIKRYEEHIGESCTVVACGLVAEHIVPKCRSTVEYNPTLMLDGLCAIYCKNS